MTTIGPDRDARLDNTIFGYQNFSMSAIPAAALEVRSMSGLFRALGDETRLRVVALLSHGELCVCQIEEALAIPQPTVSRHLGILRAAGVVETRREGSWVYYGLATQEAADRAIQLDALVRSFAKRTVLRRDLGRLVKARGPQACRR